MPEQTSGPSWTPEDVDRLAEAEGKRRNGPASDGRGWYRTESDRMECYAIAETALAALAEAGRLREPGGTEWGYRCDAGCEHTHLASEREARLLAAGRRGALVRRWVGPWLPVEATDTPKEPDHG